MHQYKPTDVSYWNYNLLEQEDLSCFLERSKKISIVIPVLNEEKGIRDIIRACKKYADEILVVDGYSTDNTRQIAEQEGVRVIVDNGLGKGAAIRHGIAEASGDILVFIDADYSHDPADIPRLVLPILRGEADHVMGSRTRGGSDELHGDFNKFCRMIGSDIITLGINYKFNVRFTDSQNGFRALLKVVAQDLGLKENITTIEQEMVIKTLRKGYILKEIPSHEYARRFGESRIRLSKVSFRYVYSWLRYLFFP